MKRREGFGFQVEKMKCILSIVPVESLEKSRECFSLEKHSPNAGLRGTGRCTCVFSALSVSSTGEHEQRTLASDASETLFMCPVLPNVSKCASEGF